MEAERVGGGNERADSGIEAAMLQVERALRHSHQPPTAMARGSGPRQQQHLGGAPLLPSGRNSPSSLCIRLLARLAVVFLQGISA